MTDFWNERFGGDHFFYGTEPNQFLKEQAGNFLPGGKILSLGEGEGRNAVFLAELGLQVTASDTSHAGFQKMQKLADSRNVQVSERLENVVSGNWDDETWDGILNIFCHVTSEGRKIIAEKAAKSLKPGGIFLTEQFSKEQLNYTSGGPKDPDMLVSLEEFETEFSSDFEIILLEKKVIYLDEGHHKGDGSVVRLIARKI